MWTKRQFEAPQESEVNREHKKPRQWGKGADRPLNLIPRLPLCFWMSVQARYSLARLSVRLSLALWRASGAWALHPCAWQKNGSVFGSADCAADGAACFLLFVGFLWAFGGQLCLCHVREHLRHDDGISTPTPPPRITAPHGRKFWAPSRGG